MPDATTLQFKNTQKALEAAGFVEEDIAALALGEVAHGPVVNWPLDTFTTVLDSIRGRAAHGVVAETKAGNVDQPERAVNLPAKPPYLSKPSDYNPRDASQFYTDPDTSEMYRWDGKGRSKTGYRNLLDMAVRRPGEKEMPFGEVHRVAVVAHKRYGETLLPNEREAAAATAAGHHWFHHGYKVWIGDGGKKIADPTREARLKVSIALAARERDYDADPSRPMSRIPARA